MRRTAMVAALLFVFSVLGVSEDSPPSPLLDVSIHTCKAAYPTGELIEITAILHNQSHDPLFIPEHSRDRLVCIHENTHEVVLGNFAYSSEREVEACGQSGSGLIQSPPEFRKLRPGKSLRIKYLLGRDLPVGEWVVNGKFSAFSDVVAFKSLDGPELIHAMETSDLVIDAPTVRFKVTPRTT